MRRAAVVLALVVGACAKEKAPASPASARTPAPVVPAPVADAERGRSAPLYQSGSRLKIRWAQPLGAAPDVRMVHAIFDTKLGRECVLPYGSAEGKSCFPVADREADDEDIAYLEEGLKTVVLMVDPLECTLAPAADTSTLWALSPITQLDAKATRYHLDAPRRVPEAYTAEGPGCVVHFKRRRGPLCVRAFRPADPSDVVQMKETVLGSDGAGVVVAAGSDGSILPVGGSVYRDARHDFRCAITSEADTCLPAAYDLMMSEPSVGTVVDVISSYPGGSRWAVWHKERAWAELSPFAADAGTFQTRTVVSLLGDVIHFPTQVAEPAARIALHQRTMPDGRAVPVSLYDTKLQRDCKPTKTDDGNWRCTVKLPMSCDEREVVEADVKKSVLSPSSSFCNGKRELCCHGGTVWFPAQAARAHRRFGYNPSAREAVPGRAVRYAEAPRTAELLYDQLEVLTEDAFARLHIVQDR
ncbi:MAG: hypothetical protein JWM74_2537 [Myxococcaceae bacterium]|nr:hypothetical protein [Myxococcaceae bacterium]